MAKKTKFAYYTNKISKLKPGKQSTFFTINKSFPSGHPFEGLLVRPWDIETERANIHFAAAKSGVKVKTIVVQDGSLAGAMRVSLA